MPLPPDRLAHINELTAQYYEQRLPGSWAQPYLTERLRQDITGHPTIRPGYAPDGWTNLIHHLRVKGVTDDEMLATGVAICASTGRLIDRFRDRAVFPITHDGQVLGFVGRRNPTGGDDKRIPKYLNTADTPLFHKGDQLFVTGPTDDRVPVLVGGPMDAVAVTLALSSTHVGVAPLGTALTEAQAAELAVMHPQPIVAADNDEAGRAAAARDYWILALHGADPRQTDLPDGTDPALLLANGDIERLHAAVACTVPGSTRMIKHLASLSSQRLSGALAAASAAPPHRWEHHAAQIADLFHIPKECALSALADAVRAWNSDPHRTARALTERTLKTVDVMEYSRSSPPPRADFTSTAASRPPQGQLRPEQGRHATRVERHIRP